MEYEEMINYAIEIFLLLSKHVQYVLNQVYSRYSISQFCSILKECMLIINFKPFYEVK